MSHVDIPLKAPVEFRGGKTLLVGGAAAAVIGLGLFAVGIGVDRKQAFFSYLTAWTFVTSLALGSLLFLMITHAMGAKWPVVLRRLSETIAWTLPVLGILFIPVAIGLEDLYLWTSHSTGDAHLDHLLHHKSKYLNVGFFVGRTVFFFAVWTVAAFLLRKWSLDRDRNKDLDVSGRQKAVAAALLPAVGLSLTFAAFDWLMSLSPAWFSTMFGVYYFAGGFLGGLALLTILAARAWRDDALLGGMVATSHFYALGRLLFGFVVFWAYIAFFQLFIIYAANKPEEVTWYVIRLEGSWRAMGLVLLFAHFVVPFFALISYGVKRRPGFLAAISAWLLVIHYVDLHWIVMPTLHPTGFRPHWLDVVTLLGVGGAALAFGVLSLRGKAIAPGNDPAFAASLRYRSQ